jgi:hypothetical protein
MRRGLAAAVAASAVIGWSGAALAGPYRLISFASDSGVHHAASGFDTGVAEPTDMILRVKVEPNKPIELKYQVGCRSGSEHEAINRKPKVRSGEIQLPLLVAKPSSCLVFTFATYDNPRFDQRVHFRVELRATQRPGAPPPD